MTSSEPPRIATWMLAHLTPTDHNEALAGDLLESFRAGRSKAWYWRQALSTLVIEWTRSLISQRVALIFAAAWATVAPAWRLVITKIYHLGDFVGPVWRLPWPWSTVSALGLSAAEDLVFIWTGATLCLLLLLKFFGLAKYWRIRRAFTFSVAGYVCASVCGIAIRFMTIPLSTQHATDWKALTLSGVITNFGLWSLVMRFPYLIGTACALWGVIPRHKNPMKLAG